MSYNPKQPPKRPIFILAAAVGILLYFLTEIAYVLVAARALPGYRPIGMVALAMDINSYYSFIHQAADGHWLFRNDMTYQPCDRVFFNLQWLAVGKCMGWFDWSPLLTFKAWRFAGAIALMLGFAALAIVVLPRTWQRVTALIMCAFGGGFGWILAILGTFGLLNTSKTFGLKNPAIDLINAVHPFGQVLKNPHYSLPHGTFLLFLALYVLGEKSRKPRWYVAAAAMAVAQGLMRPYDLITICAVAPLFIIVEAALARQVDWRLGILRALPALVSLPLFGYFYYIFAIHPVFKYWASQGDQPPAPIHWHVLALGLAGVLFAWRMTRLRTQPFAGSAERLLVVFAAAVFILFHGNHLSNLLAFSPQIGIPLLPPLILIGVGVLPVIADRIGSVGRRQRAAWLTAFLLVNAIGSALFVTWNANIGTTMARNYLRESDVDAIAWLAAHADHDDVVLTTENMGSRISFFMPVRVALGHWALTPDVKALGNKFAKFSAGDMPRGKAKEFLETIAPRFIYITDRNDAADATYFRKAANAKLAFSNDTVAIYEIEGPALPVVTASRATTSSRESDSS